MQAPEHFAGQLESPVSLPDPTYEPGQHETASDEPEKDITPPKKEAKRRCFPAGSLPIPDPALVNFVPEPRSSAGALAGGLRRRRTSSTAWSRKRKRATGRKFTPLAGKDSRGALK